MIISHSTNTKQLHSVVEPLVIGSTLSTSVGDSDVQFEFGPGQIVLSRACQTYDFGFLRGRCNFISCIYLFI